MAEPLKKILISIDWFDPAYKAGGPVQSCKNLIAALNNEFEFYILTSDRDEGDAAPFENITFNQWIPYSKNAKVYYIQGKADLKQIITSVKPDIVYFNSMYSYPFTIKPLMALRRLKKPPAIVLAPRGMLQEGAMRFKRTKKKLFLALMRLFHWERKIHFHATDNQEREDILKHFPRAKSVFVAANFPAQRSSEWQPVVKKIDTIKCVFLSRIVPKKNLLFLIQAICNTPVQYNVQLEIWGSAEEKKYLDECMAAAAKAPAHIKITFNGPVKNDQLGNVYKNSHLFALPTHGENFGHVIFEALQHGVPVLISDRTPWANLTATHSGHVLPINDPGAWTKTISVFAAMDQHEFNKWSQGAYAYAQEYKVRNDPGKEYRSAFQSVITSNN